MTTNRMQDTRLHHICGDLLDARRAGLDAGKLLDELLDENLGEHRAQVQTAAAMVGVAAGLLEQARVYIAQRTAPLDRCRHVHDGVRCVLKSGHEGWCAP